MAPDAELCARTRLLRSQELALRIARDYIREDVAESCTITADASDGVFVLVPADVEAARALAESLGLTGYTSTRMQDDAPAHHTWRGTIGVVPVEVWTAEVPS